MFFVSVDFKGLMAMSGEINFRTEVEIANVAGSLKVRARA